MNQLWQSKGPELSPKVWRVGISIPVGMGNKKKHEESFHFLQENEPFLGFRPVS